MNPYCNQKLSSTARTLRRNMTNEERRLWYDFLKTLSIPVKRQKVFGRYIVDFYIPQAKLVIELDGSQHYEAEGLEMDAQRDAYFQSMGIGVLRYSNADIRERFQSVCEDILDHVPDVKNTSE